MAIDYNSLAKKALKTAGGPSVLDEERAQQKDDLLVKALSALANQKPAQAAPAPKVEVNVPPAQVEVVVQKDATKPPTGWTFEFERNGDGTIRRIHATPKE